MKPLLKHPDKKQHEQQEKSEFPPIKCIPSNVTLVPGDTTDERLLHTVAVSGEEERTEDEKRTLAVAKNRWVHVGNNPYPVPVT